MNRLRCIFFAATLVISIATFASGGVIQGPGKSDPSPTPTPTAITTAPASDGLTQPGQQNEIEWQDATAVLVEILFSIF